MTEKTSYQEQLELLENYFRAGEKTREDFLIGLEVEHFIVDDKTLKAIPYSPDGVREILAEMQDKSWLPLYEDNFLMGLNGDKALITLEPGSQLELSIKPCTSLNELERIYEEFRAKISPILARRNYLLVTLGYQPESSITDIELIPKKRYKYMFDYFKNQGNYAHNMMKGTASVQVNLDYQNEEDYRKKVRVASFLTPLVYNLLDNSPFFENQTCADKSIREEIWQNCDRNRCGLLKESFKDNYSYRDYARYILEIPAIIDYNKGQPVYTGERKIKELLIPGESSKEELAHLLSMAFPDIRTKQYLEIRMGDSLPIKFSLGYLAFWKGILYYPENLELLYQEARKISWEDMLQLRGDIKQKGFRANYLGVPLFQKFKELLNLAEKGLTPREKGYLSPLRELNEEEKTPKMITLHNLAQDKRKAIDWCTL